MIDCSHHSLVDITTHWFIDYRAWVAAARTPAGSTGASEGVKGVKQPVEKNRRDAVCGTAFAITGGYYPHLVRVTNEVLAGTKKKTITAHIMGVGIFPSFIEPLIMATRLPGLRACLFEYDERHMKFFIQIPVFRLYQTLRYMPALRLPVLGTLPVRVPPCPLAAEAHPGRFGGPHADSVAVSRV